MPDPASSQQPQPEQLPRKPAETSTALHEPIAERWSPRAFDPSAAVGAEQLRGLLEAARWAPSFGNTQPARYLVGRSGDATYAAIFATLSEGNRSWAHRVPVLLLAIALTQNAKGPVPLAEYGVGLATENLALQATASGLVTHQMAGFDASAAREAFALPPEACPVVAIAVGAQGPPELLDEPRRVERERAPRTRIPLDEFALAEWAEPAFD